MRRGGTTRALAGLVVACAAAAVAVAVAAPASAAPNDGVFVDDGGTVLDQSIDDYCQEFFDEFHSGGCEVSYVEQAGEFRSGSPVRVSAEAATCPGRTPNTLTISEEITTARSLGFKFGPAAERAFSTLLGTTIGLVGSFDYSTSVSEGSTVGFEGTVDQGRIGSIEFTPKLWYSRGQLSFTDQFDDAVHTEVDGTTPAKKVNGFTDGTYDVAQRDMTPEEVTRHCG